MLLSIFITCFNDTLFPETGRAMVRLLERLGYAVEFRPEQTCCGQMHTNSGYQREALPLVRRFVQVFHNAGTIIAPSASCVGSIREQYHMLAEQSGDPELVREVDSIRLRVFELTEFLMRNGHIDVGAYFPHRVTYHPTCHSLRVLRVGDTPMQLLRAVRGIEIEPLPEADQCCGFGGTFAIKNADTSNAMLGDKLRAVRETRAEFVVAADNSCLMHMGGALQRQRAGVRTLHIAEVLAQTEVR